MRKFTNIVALLLAALLVLPVCAEATQLIPGGQLIGLELEDQTVTIAAFDKTKSVAKEAGLLVGDRITYIDDTPITCAEDIRCALTRSKGTVQIQLVRKGKNHSMAVCPQITKDGPRLGIYLKQGISGVGPVTYYDPQTGNFGALGHSVNDSSGKVLETATGKACHAGILHIKKGLSGKPGQLMGCMDPAAYFGFIHKNTPQGIFGVSNDIPAQNPMTVAEPGQVHTGDAVIRSTVENNEVREYSVKILKIYPTARSAGRNMLLKVTDESLLSTTGGIIQGMSGSPIIQNGKLVGAVTHVLVNDPTTGYGIFIENMLDAAA